MDAWVLVYAAATKAALVYCLRQKIGTLRAFALVVYSWIMVMHTMEDFYELEYRGFNGESLYGMDRGMLLVTFTCSALFVIQYLQSWEIDMLFISNYILGVILITTINFFFVDRKNQVLIRGLNSPLILSQSLSSTQASCPGQSDNFPQP